MHTPSVNSQNNFQNVGAEVLVAVFIHYTWTFRTYVAHPGFQFISAAPVKGALYMG